MEGRIEFLSDTKLEEIRVVGYPSYEGILPDGLFFENHSDGLTGILLFSPMLAAPTISQKSIAVLPLVNKSKDEDHEYLCDGITEEIIHALTKIEGLRVTSRISSFFFKDKRLPLSEIGQQLDVSILLEGSIQFLGKQMRISIRLIDVAEDYTFWSERMDRPMDNLFATQDEISLLVADRLREHLGHFELESELVPKPEIPLNAYKSYLRSRYYILKMNNAEIRKGLDILQELVGEVPDYPYAYLGIHMGYVMLGTLGFMPPVEAFMEGRKYLEKAIELDEGLPECQLQLAWMSFLEHWDLDATYAHLQRVRNQQPMVDYYQTMASVLISERKYKAAMHYIDTVLQIDPFSDVTHHLKGFILYAQGKFEEAISFYQKSYELKPDSDLSHLEWGLSLILLNQPDKALAHYESLSQETDPILLLGGKALSYLALGQSEKADQLQQELLGLLSSAQSGRALQLLILLESRRGNQEQALDYLEQAIQYRLPMLVYMKIDPFLESLASHPRFARLMDPVLGTPSAFQFTEPKYKKSLLEPGLVKDLRKQLTTLMEAETPYLDPYLTLRDLAERLGIPPNQLSQLLNEGFEQNFSAFVNTYRLAAFKERLFDPKNKHLTLLALAYESGFNSKTVFNTFFKKAEGMTPRAYQKSMMGK